MCHRYIEKKNILKPIEKLRPVLTHRNNILLCIKIWCLMPYYNNIILFSAHHGHDIIHKTIVGLQKKKTKYKTGMEYNLK